ncbi:MBL fold metallo-hydrolase [Oceanicola sp. S124]|uniref:MBL fold metallo-hydrolase n=1 Tax=Oceanicola sp. S124 TaxID=1042378 RepID=UPI0002559F2D|nr:MBL fold metallo-hydrolase [Oceanicola sp. S124]
MTSEQRFAPVPGRAEEVAPGVRRILAANPSPFTGPGTNTYLVGETALAVIDPGPDLAVHLRAILKALRPGQQVSHILVTHAHADHSPLSRALSVTTGAPVLAYGDAGAGRSEIMARLAGSGGLGGGEGTDTAFRPDHELSDGQTLLGEGWSLRAFWTPGHFGNHLCFAFDDVIFTGDLVMGWSSSLVSPPDGDLTDFMASCRRLRALPARLFLPGHGPAVTEPRARLDWLIRHRERREASLLQALARGPATADDLARRVYTDIEPGLLPAASRNILAHLIDLMGKSLVSTEGDLTSDSQFRLF